jgi:hypothetical protein
MAGLSDVQTEATFDWFSSKTDDGIRCPICQWNSFSMETVRQMEQRNDPGPEVGTMYLQVIGQNCKHVMWFTDTPLHGS